MIPHKALPVILIMWLITICAAIAHASDYISHYAIFSKVIGYGIVLSAIGSVVGLLLHTQDLHERTLKAEKTKYDI